MDIFITLFTFIVITLRGMKAFLLIFLVNPKDGMGVSIEFRVNTPWGCTKSWFAEDLCMGKLDGEASILCCIYLFICLLFVYLLFVCVFTF